MNYEFKKSQNGLFETSWNEKSAFIMIMKANYTKSLVIKLHPYRCSIKVGVLSQIRTLILIQSESLFNGCYNKAANGMLMMHFVPSFHGFVTDLRISLDSSADIHDYGHDTIESGLLYDTERHILMYYSPAFEEIDETYSIPNTFCPESSSKCLKTNVKNAFSKRREYHVMRFRLL